MTPAYPQTIQSMLILSAAHRARLLVQLLRIPRPRPVARMSQISSVPDWVTYEEKISRYEFGGAAYRPTAKGDLLNNGRYEILKKLGWGQYATVWLAKDNQDAEGACVAIKILDTYSTGSPLIHELEVLRVLRGRNPQHPGFSHVPRLHDAFTTESRFGSHLCTATDVMGVTLPTLSGSALREVQCRFPGFIAKVVMRHVLLALDYCHTECGVVHTDVKITNVMTTFGPGYHLKASDEVVAVQDPEPFHAKVADGSEVMIYQSHPMASISGSVNDVESWNEVVYKLVDFGTARPMDKAKEHFTQLVIPIQTRAPELALGASWGCPVDIWAAGCMLFFLYTLRPIVPHDITDALLPLFQWRIFGDFPAELVRHSSRGSFYFDEHGHLLDELLQELIATPRFGKTRVSLDEYMDEVTNGSGVVVSDSGRDFLRRMLEVDPVKRATAKELLEHPWLRF